MEPTWYVYGVRNKKQNANTYDILAWGWRFVKGQIPISPSTLALLACLRICIFSHANVYMMCSACALDILEVLQQHYGSLWQNLNITDPPMKVHINKSTGTWHT